MAVEYDPHPERSLGTETVFIAWDEQEHLYLAHWDSLPEDDPGRAIEEGPRTSDISEIVGWARQRTSRVLIRPESDPPSTTGLE
jgi:hypothetical protein